MLGYLSAAQAGPSGSSTSSSTGRSLPPMRLGESMTTVSASGAREQARKLGSRRQKPSWSSKALEKGFILEFLVQITIFIKRLPTAGAGVLKANI